MKSGGALAAKITDIDRQHMASAEEEKCSGPDDLMPVGLIHWIIRPVLHQEFEDPTATLVCE